jgi:hypothetical protein
MSVNPKSFMEPIDIWAESISNTEYRNTIAGNEEKITNLTKKCDKLTEQLEEMNMLKKEVTTLKKKLELLFNNGFILRNKNTKTILRVETNPPSNHWDIVAKRLGTGVIAEYDPPSKPTNEGGKGTENIIWTFEVI